MGVGRAVCILGLAAIIGTGAGYAVYITNNRPEPFRQSVESMAGYLDDLRKTRPDKYLATKQYVIDDVVSNPYDNMAHVRRIVDTALRSDQKETLRTMIRFYGEEVKGIFNRRID